MPEGKRRRMEKEGVEGSMGFTEMVTGVCQSPRNTELRFGQPGGSRVWDLGENGEELKGFL
jgi:hypothetical protein